MYELQSNSGEGSNPDELSASLRHFNHEYEAFLVQTEFECIQKAVKRVSFDFTASFFSKSGNQIMQEDIQTPGNYIRYRENGVTCPVIVIAINLGKGFWCVLCGNECGPMKCDELLAMKCARLRFQNLKILREALANANLTVQISAPSDWRASLLLHQTGPESIIDEITWRSV